MIEPATHTGNRRMNEILRGKICPYCSSKTKLIDSKEIYGKSYGYAYICKDCNAYSGCHHGGTLSYGMIANYDLREMRKKTHELFDVLWLNRSPKTRAKLYRQLSKFLGIDFTKTHIGMFNLSLCKKTIMFTIIKKCKFLEKYYELNLK